MRHALIAAILALAASAASADLIARNAGNELRLTQEPCTHEAIAPLIKPELLVQFKRGTATIPRGSFALCWADTGEGIYFVIFEDGSATGYPVPAFTSAPGV